MLSKYCFSSTLKRTIDIAFLVREGRGFHNNGPEHLTEHCFMLVCAPVELDSHAIFYYHVYEQTATLIFKNVK